MKPVFLLLCLLWARTAGATCASPVGVNEFYRHLSLGDAAFGNMDIEAFRDEAMWVEEALPCLTDGLNSGQVTSLYRLRAWQAFVNEDEAGTMLFMMSLLTASPDYELRDLVAPDGHPLRLYLEVAREMPVIPGDHLATPRVGWIGIDGVQATEVPNGRPFLFQYFDAGGRVMETAMVLPGDEIPRYPGSLRSRSRLNLPVAILAGTAAVGSGGLYVAANRAEARFWNPDTPDGDLEDLRTRANGLSWASLVMGSVAVSSGVFAVWTGAY